MASVYIGNGLTFNNVSSTNVVNFTHDCCFARWSIPTNKLKSATKLSSLSLFHTSNAFCFVMTNEVKFIMNGYRAIRLHGSA